MFQTVDIRTNKIFSDNREVRHNAIEFQWAQFHKTRETILSKQWEDVVAPSVELGSEAVVYWDEQADTGRLILNSQDINVKLERESPAFGQILSHYGFHQYFAGKLLDTKNEHHRELFEFTLNRLMREPFSTPKEEAGRMLRIMDTGEGREAMAFLSDKYLRLDHEPVFHHTERMAREMGLVPMQTWARGGEMGLTFVSPERREVEMAHVRDSLAWGIAFRNSMTGGASFQVDPFVWRLVCTNGMIAQEFLKRYSRRHVGGRITERGTVSMTGKEQSTITGIMRLAHKQAALAMDPSLQAEMQEAITTAANRPLVDNLDAWRTARVNFLGDAKKSDAAARVVSNVTDLTLGQSRTVLNRLFSQPEGFETLDEVRPTQWGLVNAITSMGRDVIHTNAIQGRELEEQGGYALGFSEGGVHALGAGLVRALA